MDFRSKLFFINWSVIVYFVFTLQKFWRERERSEDFVISSKIKEVGTGRENSKKNENGEESSNWWTNYGNSLLLREWQQKPLVFEILQCLCLNTVDLRQDSCGDLCNSFVRLPIVVCFSARPPFHLFLFRSFSILSFVLIFHGYPYKFQSTDPNSTQMSLVNSKFELQKEGRERKRIGTGPVMLNRVGKKGRKIGAVASFFGQARISYGFIFLCETHILIVHQVFDEKSQRKN